MSLQDAVRTQLIEIIEWVDDSRETLSYRFPDEDKEIKRSAKLIVREPQAAQFVYLGQFGPTSCFDGAGARISIRKIPKKRLKSHANYCRLNGDGQPG